MPVPRLHPTAAYGAPAHPALLVYREKDIDEVLQTDRVFVNVAQGEFAKHSELKLAFGTDNEAEICLEVNELASYARGQCTPFGCIRMAANRLSVVEKVLKLGEVQISEKERAKQHDECFHEIATIVVEKCVDANTNRALTVAMVERAMKQIQIRVLPNKSAKQQVRTRIASVHNQWG